jgi:hypothetical protein
VTGKYFCCRKIKEPSQIVYDEVLAAELWEFTEELTGYTNTFLRNNKLYWKIDDSVENIQTTYYLSAIIAVSLPVQLRRE